MSDSDELDFAVGFPTGTGGDDASSARVVAVEFSGVANDPSAATPDSEELDFAGGALQEEDGDLDSAVPDITPPPPPTLPKRKRASRVLGLRL